MDSLQPHYIFNVTSISEVHGQTGVVKTFYTVKQLFRGVENYFIDAILYKDEQEEETNDGNEADTKPNDNIEKAYVELNPLVINLRDVTINLMQILKANGYL